MTNRARFAGILLLAACPLLAGAAAKKTKDAKEAAVKTERIVNRDATGSYSAKGNGTDQFSLDVAQSDSAVSLELDGVFGISGHTCECAMDGTPTGPGRWKLSGDATGTFNVVGEKIIVELDTPPECCGVGYPGAPDFKAAEAKAPKSCTVKADKAVFADAHGTATKKFLLKREKVEAFFPDGEEDKTLVLARSSGKGRRTIGFLKAGDLNCPVSASAPAPAAAPASTGTTP